MAVFNFTPLYTWQKTHNHNVLVTTFESGKEQRRYKGARPRTWTLAFRDTVANIDLIRAFYDDRKGPYEAFSWTPPGTTTTVTVRFEEKQPVNCVTRSALCGLRNYHTGGAVNVEGWRAV